ncbi:hypothetical protein ACFSUK_34715 [Sphingobium scionense]|uniref:Uncharacterized protein n=1 Tax=Sphingobium scionense TaxID=1404341 RepID=A0A7W6LMD7_9SPHN|nr:hypothetical protein [Sphingobium scionense]MBB4147054.1 hypothetical protein [Sphingobium scionense]
MKRPTNSLSVIASLAILAQPVTTGMTALSASGFLLAVAASDSAQAAPPRKRPGGGGARPSRPAGGGAHRPAGGRPAGGRPPVRNHGPTNVNHGGHRNNISNNNVNVNVNHGGNHYDGGHRDHYDHHDRWDDDWDDHWHPVATAAAISLTAAAIGSIVRSVPPDCSTVIVNGISYSQCGNTWYQPQYAGSSVQYVVVNPPR